MKLLKMNKDTGIGKVAVVSNRGVLRHLEYPLDSLFDWYPCCQKYDYKLSETRKKMYLVLTEPESKTLRYSVGAEKNRVDSKVGMLRLAKWYNKEVKEENERLYAFAKGYDLVTPDQDYDLPKVTESITKVLDILDMLYKFEYNRLREYYLNLAEKGELVGEPKRAYNTFVTADREDKASAVLEGCEQAVNELYERFGEVYVMLQVMRKVVE